jgi:RND family efflux transporter MFP subunit
VSTTTHRRRGWVIAVSGIAVALLIVGYGIWKRGVALNELQQQTDDSAIPRVQVTTPKPGPTERTVTLSGNVVAWNEAPIYAQVSGYVTAWYKDYGAHVEKGELLAEIDAPGLNAQYKANLAQLDTAQTNYNLAAVTAERYNKLKGTAAVSQQQIDNFVSAAAAAKAQLAAAQENADRYAAMIGFEKVMAPFAGTITARLVNIGDFVTSTGGDAVAVGAAKPLFNVADVSKLRVYVDVPQSFGNVLSPAIKATLTLPNAPDKPIKASFLTTAAAVRTNTRTIVTELVVEDGQMPLLPGAYVEVHLTVPGAPNRLIVPSQALLFRAQGTQVATVDEQNRAHLVPVSLGDNFGLDVEIRGGLKATDRIIANPSLGLLEGQEVKVTQATHGYELTDTAKPAP